MSWTNENVLQFIDLYRRERILWDPTYPQNKNRGEVTVAWIRIQSCFNIDCSIEDLKKKKESLMSSFRLHLKRKKKNPNYRPIWFAYNSMEAFLCEKYECDRTDELENEFFNNTESYKRSQTTDPILCRNTSSPEKRNNVRQPRLKSFPNKSNCRKQTDESTINSKDLNEDDRNIDECDLYGKLLAKKLRRLDEHQRDMVMNKIDNIIFKTKMQSGSSQSRSYSSSPIFLITQENQTQYEDENTSY